MINCNSDRVPGQSGLIPTKGMRNDQKKVAPKHITKTISTFHSYKKKTEKKNQQFIYRPSDCKMAVL